MLGGVCVVLLSCPTCVCLSAVVMVSQEQLTGVCSFLCLVMCIFPCGMDSTWFSCNNFHKSIEMSLLKDVSMYAESGM
jgi:hypothetical protein